MEILRARDVPSVLSLVALWYILPWYVVPSSSAVSVLESSRVCSGLCVLRRRVTELPST